MNAHGHPQIYGDARMPINLGIRLIVKPGSDAQLGVARSMTSSAPAVALTFAATRACSARTHHCPPLHCPGILPFRSRLATAWGVMPMSSAVCSQVSHSCSASGRGSAGGAGGAFLAASRSAARRARSTARCST